MNTDKILNAISEVEGVQICKIKKGERTLIEFTLDNNEQILTCSVPLVEDRILFNELNLTVDETFMECQINLGGCMKVLTVIQHEITKEKIWHM